MGSRLPAASLSRRARRWAAPFAVGAVVILASGSAFADRAEMSKEAKARLQRGLEHYAEKDYEAAIAEFSTAYDVEPHPQFLYAWAQAERLSGDCPSAVTLYQRFLDSDPEASQADAAAKNKARCEEALGTEPDSPEIVPAPPTPPPEPILPAEAAPSRPEPVPASQSPTLEEPKTQPPGAWYEDVLGGTLLGVGIASTGVGAAFMVASSSDVQTAGRAERGEPTETYGQHVSRLDRAQTKRTASVILLATGGASMAAAIVRYIVVGTSEPERPAGIGMWVGIDGGGATYGRPF